MPSTQCRRDGEVRKRERKRNQSKQDQAAFSIDAITQYPAEKIDYSEEARRRIRIGGPRRR
jgi:hypothetical protein